MALRRFTKQIVVAVVFLLLLGGFVALLYVVTRPAPTCFDRVQNQNEEGIDCGGVCALACRKAPRFGELSLGRVAFFSTTDRLYDVMGEIENENLNFGAPSFSYAFTLFDSASSVIISHKGTSYILPGERKTLVEQRLASNGRAPVRAELAVSDIVWEEVSSHPDITLDIQDRSFAVLDDGTSRASGVVVNRTGLDFGSVDVAVVLRDDVGTVVGAGKTDIQTLRDNDQRYFELRWPPGAVKNVSKVDMEAHTNVFLNENFLEHYSRGRLERFRQEVPAPF